VRDFGRAVPGSCGNFRKKIEENEKFKKSKKSGKFEIFLEKIGIFKVFFF
jgi:hypothetical protein